MARQIFVEMSELEFMQFQQYLRLIRNMPPETQEKVLDVLQEAVKRVLEVQLAKEAAQKEAARRS